MKNSTLLLNLSAGLLLLCLTPVLVLSQERAAPKPAVEIEPDTKTEARDVIDLELQKRGQFIDRMKQRREDCMEKNSRNTNKMKDCLKTATKNTIKTRIDSKKSAETDCISDKNDKQRYKKCVHQKTIEKVRNEEAGVAIPKKDSVEKTTGKKIR
jgi:hypothetical protein